MHDGRGGGGGHHARLEALTHSARFEEKGDSRAKALALSAHGWGEGGEGYMPRQEGTGTQCTGYRKDDAPACIGTGAQCTG